MLRIIVDPLKFNETQRRNIAALIMSISPEAIGAVEESEELTPAAAFAPAPVTIQPPVISVAPSVNVPELIAANLPAPVVPAPPSNVVTMPPAAPVAVVSTGNVEVDSTGIPWDERIHASTKVRTEKGEWRRKRGVTDELVASVEAELKKLMNIPTVVAPPAPVAVAPAAPAPVVAAPPAPVAALAPVATAEPTATREGYIELIKKASIAIGAKRIDKSEIDAICVEMGIPTLALIANRLDLVPAVSMALDALLATKQ